MAPSCLLPVAFFYSVLLSFKGGSSIDVDEAKGNVLCPLSWYLVRGMKTIVLVPVCLHAGILWASPPISYHDWDCDKMAVF